MSTQQLEVSRPFVNSWIAPDYGKPRTQNVSISTFAEWEKNLLQDPKVHLSFEPAFHSFSPDSS